LLHFVTDRVKHSPDLLIQSLVQDNPEPRWPNRMQSRNLRAFPVENDATQQFRRECAIPLSIQRDEVFLLDLKARVREALREIAVVGEQQQPFALSVEPADVEEPWKLSRQQIENCIARMRIGARRDKSGWFMQRDSEGMLRVNKFTVDFDVIPLARLRAKIHAHAAIDHYASVGDELVAFAARRDASRGKKAV
jgi:hypothetical protein